ncbi:hypothetical protein GpartN1_g4693.t1 [Galdieria partita]|uniref:Uncharacterized protein n=1 Tax=Galdieria partita TaxID=83374 RepID=A0A9C7UQ33_9RHOD|nr:hypothetical protein GpartN1_g3335.t1 [Galdieria partita]GJQ12296.1 hypothetical protein GpartN1_g4087.t1 [Galdieria partita]GJQ12902.1 hypothetical protein GpartN1_g4693.t1 [Galdieria partita]
MVDFKEDRFEESSGSEKFFVSCYLFVWISSIVVFGGAADVASVTGHCNGYCGFSIACGVLSFLINSTILIFYLFQLERILKFQYIPIIFLVLLWAAGTGVVSSVHGESVNTPVSVAFSWLSLIGSLTLLLLVVHKYSKAGIHVRLSLSPQSQTKLNTTNASTASSTYPQA